jgi:hypothetical protein
MTNEELSALAFMTAHEGFETGDATEAIYQALIQVRTRVMEDAQEQIARIRKAREGTTPTDHELLSLAKEMIEMDMGQIYSALRYSVRDRTRRETLNRVITLADEAVDHHVEPGWSHFVDFSRRLEEELE